MDRSYSLVQYKIVYDLNEELIHHRERAASRETEREHLRESTAIENSEKKQWAGEEKLQRTQSTKGEVRECCGVIAILKDTVRCGYVVWFPWLASMLVCLGYGFFSRYRLLDRYLVSAPVSILYTSEFRAAAGIEFPKPKMNP